MEPIDPPWQAIKEWIPDDEPDLDWFNRPRNPSNPDSDGYDQSPTWKAPEIPVGRRPHPGPRIHLKIRTDSPKNRSRKNSWRSALESYARDIWKSS